jgi:hypothetical protein
MRAGTTKIRINNKFYIIPDVFLFKSKSNKDVYLSGVMMEPVGKFKYKSTAIIKFIEEDRLEAIPYDIIEGYLKNKHKKVVIDEIEYDIPLEMIEGLSLNIRKIHKKDIKSLNELKEKYSAYIFKQ